MQAYLVEAATRTFDPDELPIGDERELPKVSIGEAINIAKLKACGPANPAEDSWEYGESNIEEVRERILEKLQRLRERNEAEERESGQCWSCGQELPAHRLPDDAGWQDLPEGD